MNTYVNLTAEQIERLVSTGCTALNWDDVKVIQPFDPSRYRNVNFSGPVRLGRACTARTIDDSGITYLTGVYNATLSDVTIGDEVIISDIGNYISGVDIANDCTIVNVDRIMAHRDSTNGIGIAVSVLNETGGREVPISPSLSAHTAYLMAMYRHDSPLNKALCDMVSKEAEIKSNERTLIGQHTQIRNTGTIIDVTTGEATIIDGATRLVNGTIASTAADPVYVGANVIAQDFIFTSGARVEDGAMILHSFVGQGSHISRLFSAHDSLFFANCTCENGEAAAIFAGPYTVTMHKSSLLIAGLFSFLNAGSGSNQSNHMYKLGPIHQGVVERGSKTTSDSYILWPARIGAFSLVMGRHVTHPDTSMLPFSYLIEGRDGSNLVPGANLRSVGTIRDAQKWPRRDRRRDPHHLDHINFNLLSPYTVSRMLDGIALLTDIETTSGLTSEIYSFQGMTIRARALRRGRELYRLAVDKFMGNSVLSRLHDVEVSDPAILARALKPTHRYGKGNWIDVAGLIAPHQAIDDIICDICNGSIDSLELLNNHFHTLASEYYDMEWTWVADKFEQWWGKPIDCIDAHDIRQIADRWINAVTAIDNMLLDDARKEFSRVSATSFGVDRKVVSEADFEAVRGSYETDPFVCMVHEHIVSKTALHDDLISRLCHP